MIAKWNNVFKIEKMKEKYPPNSTQTSSPHDKSHAYEGSPSINRVSSYSSSQWCLVVFVSPFVEMQLVPWTTSTLVLVTEWHMPHKAWLVLYVSYSMLHSPSRRTYDTHFRERCQAWWYVSSRLCSGSPISLQCHIDRQGIHLRNGVCHNYRYLANMFVTPHVNILSKFLLLLQPT